MLAEVARRSVVVAAADFFVLALEELVYKLPLKVKFKRMPIKKKSNLSYQIASTSRICSIMISHGCLSISSEMGCSK